MSRLLLTLSLLAAFVPARPAFAQQTSVPVIPYRSVPDFLRLPICIWARFPAWR